MFEHIVLRRAERGEPISFGKIVEALVYYQRVHLVLDRTTVFGLVKQIGVNGVLALLYRPDVSGVYCEETLGVATNDVGVLQVHSFIAFTISGSEGGRIQLKHPDDRLSYELERQGTGKKEAKAFASKFFQRIPIRKLSGDHFSKIAITEAAKSDLLDPSYTQHAIRGIVHALDGGYDPGADFKFDVRDSGLGLYVFHDLDLATINLRRASMNPPQEALTVAFILGQVQDASADLALASFYSGDFVTSAIASSLIRVRHEELLRRSGLNAEARDQFLEVVLPDSPTIAEVVDAGERTVKEAFSLVDKAARFKTWLASVNPNEGLVRTYMKDVTAEGWINTIPGKTLRYMLTLGADAVHPAAGVAAGFADSFLLDKLLGGWRPNHFVEKRLVRFVG